MTERTQRPRRTALVTGASAGIGRAIARHLAADGMRVAVHYRQRREAAQETVAAIEAAGGRAFALGADLTADRAIDALFSALEAALDGGRLDVLVNNAGVASDREDPTVTRRDGFVAGISDVTPEEFDELFALNVRAPFFVTQRALPLLADGARIINISSVATRIAWPLLPYAMSKGALEMMAPRLAQQLGARGITVNTVAPGITDTEMNNWVHETPGAEEAISEMTALRRLGRPDDISAVVSYLASDEARWVTGQLVDASGGMCLAPGGM
ncbi:SDR family oxidoreductase [Streptomyces sp. AV19]|uniref:SDR family oxidoreductase n=1 Tax=Streptomyces sp. AV19 TaxID=2793068 RepID=UPI0018FF100E|nr:SDR family oxidoreductase [Streptomyces sp. AV19]MBH1939170.1 SDR family oxidoreductase [Streptomyces sp. AV19]MDG4533642.1 SDR family oxidoreductase [Streptomyces sp. AV19]